jgi:hypothetical protein
VCHTSRQGEDRIGGVKYHQFVLGLTEDGIVKRIAIGITDHGSDEVTELRAAQP